jgi:mannosyltransferase OCH1-like enzyme
MIPKIIHRSLPYNENYISKYCFDSIKRYCTNWQYMNHYDNDKYKIVGEYLSLCPKGAFKADLIRLEALYTYGGIYLDSDVLLFKSLDTLLYSDSFFVVEDNAFFVNSVMGATPKNPIILEMLENSINILKNNKNINFESFRYEDLNISAPFGPYIVDLTLKKTKQTFTILPSWTFNMYYQHASKVIDNPDSYGKHLYAKSWK